MTDGSSLSVTLPYNLEFHFQRSDHYSKPLIFRFRPDNEFRHSRFILLHETTLGLRKIEVPKLQEDQQFEDDVDTLQFNGWNHCICDIAPPGTLQVNGQMIGNYQKALIPGEKYHFFWPGMEIDMWEWGTRYEWKNKELISQSIRDTKPPRLVIPASNVLTFTAKVEDEPWPERAYLESGYASFAELNIRELEWRRKKYPPPLPPDIGPEAKV